MTTYTGAGVTTGMICQPSKHRAQAEINALQGLSLRAGLVTTKIRRIVG